MALSILLKQKFIQKAVEDTWDACMNESIHNFMLVYID